MDLLMNRTIPLGGTDDIALLLAVTTTLFVPFPLTIMPLDKLVGQGVPQSRSDYGRRHGGTR